MNLQKVFILHLETKIMLQCPVIKSNEVKEELSILFIEINDVRQSFSTL